MFPAAVGSIEQAKAYGRAQVDRSLAAVAAGGRRRRPGSCWASCCLVITPMEAKRS